jgi:hypothetical protein
MKKIPLFSSMIAGIMGCLLSVSLAGCRRDFPPEEYGAVITEVPSLSEAQQPFDMPKLGPPLTEDEKRKIQESHY